MKRFLRLFAILAVVAMVMAFMPSCEPKVTDERFFTFEYNEDKTAYTVSASAEVMPETVIIPETYEGKAVTAVKADGFSGENCYAIKDLVFKCKTLTVGENAFKGLKNLRSVEFRGTVDISIGSFAFEDCTALKELQFTAEPESLVFGGYSFKHTGLTAVEVSASKGVTVGEYAFANSAITGFKAANLTAFDVTAVSKCVELASFEVSESEGFVSESGNLYAVSEGVKTLVKYAPAAKAREFVVETAIGKDALRDCVNLTTVTIAECVEDIPAYTFYETSVTEIKVYSNYVNFTEGWLFGTTANVTEVA